MQIKISQSRQFKYSIVYVVKVAISYNYCFPTIMQHFVVKNAFISRHQMAQLVFRVPPIAMCVFVELYIQGCSICQISKESFSYRWLTFNHLSHQTALEVPPDLKSICHKGYDING